MKCIFIQKKVGKCRSSCLHREHVVTTGTGFLQTLHHLCWTQSLIWVRGHLSCAGSCHFVTCPSALHLSPSAGVLHTAVLLPALLSYSSCLRLVSQGSCWLPTGRDFVNLQLFDGKIEACHKDKSSSSLPLVQIQLCQSPWQYQGLGFSFHLQTMKEITQKLCTQELC